MGANISNIMKVPVSDPKSKINFFYIMVVSP